MESQTRRDTKHQLDTSHHQMKLPVSAMDDIELSCWPRGPYRNPKQLGILQKLLIALCKVMVKSSC